MVGWDPWIEKRVNYLSCIELKGRGVWKTSTVFNDSTRQLLLYDKISFIYYTGYTWHKTYHQEVRWCKVRIPLLLSKGKTNPCISNYNANIINNEIFYLFENFDYFFVP